MPSVPDMLEAINTCARLDDEFELSEWEENFIIDIEGKSHKGEALSPRQIARLESIYDRT
jgi:hypothetical protein